MKGSKESSSKSGPLSANSQPLNVHKKPPLPASASTLSVPYRGTGKATPNSTSPTTPSVDAAKAPPKKGSYAEIMARAKASQAAAAIVGVIKHKPKEALSNKKEILLRKKNLSQAKKARLNGTLGRNVSSSNGSGLSAKSPAAPKLTGSGGKQGAPGRYKGTANGKPQPSYKGTMKPVETVNSDRGKSRYSSKYAGRGASNIRSSASRDRYAGTSASDEDQEDQEDSEPDASSDDMEAGFSDVEEEEMHATKFAKQEDDEQARIEAGLKKEKEERKRRLNLMAKNAKKRAF